MTHQELFDMTPFPVFAADKNGLILYKNKAAVRYIGTMRKGSRVVRYLLGETIPQAGKVAQIAAETPYSNALVLADEEETLFLCFSRLQYPDFETIAERILTVFGKTPTEVFRNLGEICVQPKDGKTSIRRIYTELVGLELPKEIPESKAYSLGNLANTLFAKVKERFCAFGYRIQTEISQNFARKHPVNTNLFTLLSLFGYLLYFMMKLSEDGKLAITLSSEPEKEIHLLRLDTHTAYHPQKEAFLLDLFAEITPECIAELILTQETELFLEQLTVSFDPFGKVMLEYQIPYLASTLTVHSAIPENHYAALFEGFLLQICEMLKGNSSSC